MYVDQTKTFKMHKNVGKRMREQDVATRLKIIVTPIIVFHPNKPAVSFYALSRLRNDYDAALQSGDVIKYLIDLEALLLLLLCCCCWYGCKCYEVVLFITQLKRTSGSNNMRMKENVQITA